MPEEPFFYDRIVPDLVADAKNWTDVHYYGSSLITGVWDRYTFNLNPETRVIAIADGDGYGTVSVRLLPKDLRRFMKDLRIEED